MILQATFLSCTGMLTIMTSSLHTMKSKLNACSVLALKQAHRIGLTIHFPYSLPLKMVAHIWKYAEICRNCLLDYVTCTPSIGLSMSALKQGIRRERRIVPCSYSDKLQLLCDIPACMTVSVGMIH